MSYSAKNLSVFKDNKNIINEISFDFPSGSYVSIIGPNGAGKTTLLKTLAGLLDFKGSILINNVNSDDDGIVTRCYSQGLITGSRKVVAPLLKDVL